MIPVLGIFTVNSLDSFTQLVKSIDYPVDKCSVVCNSKYLDYYLAIKQACVNPLVNEFIVTHCPYNMGYSSSVNYVVKMHCDSEYWLFVGDDTLFTAGDLELANKTIQTCDFFGASESINFGTIFGFTQQCVSAVGLLDENIHPTNWEDYEYFRRVTFAGLSVKRCPIKSKHVGSGTIAAVTNPVVLDKYAKAYRLNEEYFYNKIINGDFSESRLDLRERAKKLIVFE